MFTDQVVVSAVLLRLKSKMFFSLLNANQIPMNYYVCLCLHCYINLHINKSRGFLMINITNTSNLYSLYKYSVLAALPISAREGHYVSIK